MLDTHHGVFRYTGYTCIHTIFGYTVDTQSDTHEIEIGRKSEKGSLALAPAPGFSAATRDGAPCVRARMRMHTFYVMVFFRFSTVSSYPHG